MERMQRDIDNLVNWSEEWKLDLNYNKCSVMHLGKANRAFEYEIGLEGVDRQTLRSTNKEKDLGITFTNDLKWSSHIKETLSKANRALGVIRNTFKKLDIYILRTLYMSLVRPYLDYAVSVWNPNFKKDIELIEGVHLARLVDGLAKYLSKYSGW